MPFVYILRGAPGRHCIGSTINLQPQLREIAMEDAYDATRVDLITSREFAALKDTCDFERKLRRMKNPKFPLNLVRQTDASAV